MAYNRRSGGGGFGGGNSGNYGNSFGQNGGNFGGGGGGRFNNFNNYGRNPKMSPWESGVSPGGGMMPNVHPNQMALASDLLSKLLAPNQGGYGGGQNWGPNPGMMRRQESFKNQNRRRPDNRNRRPPPKKDDKKKDSKPEEDKNDQSKQINGVKKDTTEQEHVDYDGIPTAVLFCHVCQKHMWDGASFEKHVRGRPHELMMTYLDEGYKMHVELMRHYIKAAENQREIDLERMQAQNKGKAKPLFRNYCPMCNINFYGPLTGHRKSDRHRKLKQFLHPECKTCDTLFHTRLEWDDHKLSADHLRKVGEQRRLFNPDLKDDEFELLDVVMIENDEQSQEMSVASKLDMLKDKEIKEYTDDGKYEQAEGSVQMDTESAGKKEEIDETEANTVSKEVTDNDQEVTDDTKEVTDDSKEAEDKKEEKYNPTNVVGRELVVRTAGHVCRICAVFMKNDEEAELHCQTATHYLNLTCVTKLHAKINNRKRKMKEEMKEIVDKEDEKTEENEGEQTVKRARLDESEPEETKPEEINPVAEQNGTEQVPEDNATENSDVQEVKVDDVTTNDVIEDEKMETEEPEPVVEPEPVKVIKTTPTRGRGGRGRGVARRGRSR